MFTLTKINLLWDKVKALEKNAGASRLPDVSTSDNGDVLTVVEGAWGKAAIPSQLPSVTGADNGNVLGVVEGAWAKMAAPSGGLDYSTSEQDTGLKWVDGKTIYQKSYTGTTNANPFTIDNAFTHNLIAITGSMSYELNSVLHQFTIPGYPSENNPLVFVPFIAGTDFIIKGSSGLNYNITVYYTKNTNRRTKK